MPAKRSAEMLGTKYSRMTWRKSSRSMRRPYSVLSLPVREISRACTRVKSRDFKPLERRLSAAESRYAAAGVCVKHGSRHGFSLRRRQQHVRGGVIVRPDGEIEYIVGGAGAATRAECARRGLIISR